MLSFLSTLSLRRATHPEPAKQTQRLISIHALLAESDVLVWCFCGGVFAFLSTLSLRRATFHAKPGKRQSSNFYPRSPCGERPG